MGESRCVLGGNVGAEGTPLLSTTTLFKYRPRGPAPSRVLPGEIVAPSVADAHAVGNAAYTRARATQSRGYGEPELTNRRSRPRHGCPNQQRCSHRLPAGNAYCCRYEGQWYNDLKHGEGKFFYLDKVRNL